MTLLTQAVGSFGAQTRKERRKALGVNDEQRAISMVRGAKGKRLTYRTTGGSRSATGTEQAPPF